MVGEFYGICLGDRFYGYVSRKDRIGKHYRIIVPRIFNLVIVCHPRMWAGSLYLFKRRIWLRPIDYDAVGHA